MLIIFSSLCADRFPVPALPFAPLTYMCYKATGDIIIDGKGDDASWAQAKWSESFTDIEGSLKPSPFYDTKLKMLWDDKGLYFLAFMQEEHIWGTLTERDAVIFYDNDFEIFIDPDGDSHEYYELEINALGTLWDLFLIKPYRDEHSAIDAWDLRDIKYAIDYGGTLNDPSDIDEYWSLEVFIPWKPLGQRAQMPVPPLEGDYWRMNFSRVHWEHEIVAGKYQKIPKKPEYNWVWSPQGLIAMHYPERWGYVFFSSQESADYEIPDVEYARQYLRELYYLQKQYYADHGKYAGSLRKLRAKPFTHKSGIFKPKMQATDTCYYIELDGKAVFGKVWIKEDGMCRIVK